MNHRDDIYGLSTSPGKSGIAVIRLSGPRALEISRQVAPRAEIAAGRISYAGFRDNHDHLIDRGLLLTFVEPKSFTGEDCAEFHVHGGRAVVQRMFDRLQELGARPSEPGEFTRRAFDNDKLDLIEAEGLADLINAETEAQRRQAFQQLEGRLSALYEDWRAGLMNCLALFEAEIDFADEDLPDGLGEQALAQIAEIRTRIVDHLNDDHKGERLRDGVRIAIVGPPNAGKSSLLNALARRDVAIVSDQSGTTRDVLEVHLDLDGVPVILSDTAGIRETVEAIEQEGIRRARASAERADLRCFVEDATIWNGAPNDDLVSLKKDHDILILNKADLLPGDFADGPTGAVVTSTKTGQGLASLIGIMKSRVRENYWPSETPAITRQRHRKLLEDTVDCLAELIGERSLDAAQRAESLRLAIRSLGRITGRVDVEDMLDIIFSEFCIGK